MQFCRQISSDRTAGFECRSFPKRSVEDGDSTIRDQYIEKRRRLARLHTTKSRQLANMLVLIAGVTGNLGQKLVKSLLSRGHQVRGLGRSPSKLDNNVQSSLESFVQSQNYYDISALDKACAGADAVICAYMGMPELQLEGQLLLLRAAERAGVKRFVAAAWNYDWRKMSFGQHESYDMYLPFRRMVEFTSEIRPIYILTGVLAEVLFSVPGHGDFSPSNKGVWEPTKKVSG